MDYHKLFWKVCYAICFGLFFVWLSFAIDNYLGYSTSSKISLNYGDNGNKLLRFPVVTLCKEVKKSTFYMWKNNEKCLSNQIPNKPPFFYNFLENCLINNDNEDVSDNGKPSKKTKGPIIYFFETEFLHVVSALMEHFLEGMVLLRH